MTDEEMTAAEDRARGATDDEGRAKMKPPVAAQDEELAGEVVGGRGIPADAHITSSGNMIQGIDDAGLLNADARTCRNLDIVRFHVESVHEDVAEKDWSHLEAYVTEFLTAVQGEDSHPHPSLMCSIYQAQITHLIGKKEHALAREVLHGKVKPLLDLSDDMYKPFDLEARVEMLDNCVTNRKRPKAATTENVAEAILDYIAVYFPTCMENLVVTGTVDDLLCSYGDGDEKKYRCRVCQWTIPPKADVAYYFAHLKKMPNGHRRICNRRTKCLLQRLADIERRTDSVNRLLYQSERQVQKKRKALGPAEGDSDDDDDDECGGGDDGCFSIPPGPALIVLSPLFSDVVRTYAVLYELYPDLATTAKAIIRKQELVLTELKVMAIAAIDKKVDLDDRALEMVKVVNELQYNLVPLLKTVAAGSKQILSQGKGILELMDHFCQANVTHRRSKKPVAHLAASISQPESLAKLLATEADEDEDEAEADGDGGSITIPAGFAYKFYSYLCIINMKIVIELVERYPSSAAKAKQIVFGQDGLIAEMRATITKPLKEELPVGVEELFSKVKSVNMLQYELAPLLKNLGRVSKHIIAQGKAISELSHHCMDAAFNNCPQDTPAAIVSSTATNTHGPSTPGTHASGATV